VTVVTLLSALIALGPTAPPSPPSRDEATIELAQLTYMKQRRVNRKRWVGALVDSNVPRKLICGAMDPVSGAHLADRYRELVPNPDVTYLDNVGHYPQLEAPDLVLEAYFRFRDSQQA